MLLGARGFRAQFVGVTVSVQPATAGINGQKGPDVDSPDSPPDAGGLESAAASSGRFPALDGVRAIAALAVVLTHVGFQTGQAIDGTGRTVLSRLDLGVAVFFVLSGFLLHRPQAVAALAGRALPPAVPYLWRRALRVLPGYWLAVAAALLVLPQNDGVSAGSWLRHLTFTQVYVDETLPVGLTQMWSLATEVSFYLALPLLGRLAGSSLATQLRLAGLMIATGISWQVLIGAQVLPPYAGYWLPGHADWFGLGMGLAALSAARVPLLEELAAQAGTCWLGAGALFVVAGTPLTGPYGLALLTSSEAVSRTVLYGAVATLLLLPAVGTRARGPVPSFLESRLMQWLGQISYGVFLLHLTVLAVIFEGSTLDPFTGHFWRVLALAVPASLAVGWASLRVVEAPALRLRDRGPGRRRTSRPQVGATTG